MSQHRIRRKDTRSIDYHAVRMENGWDKLPDGHDEDAPSE